MSLYWFVNQVWCTQHGCNLLGLIRHTILTAAHTTINSVGGNSPLSIERIFSSSKSLSLSLLLLLCKITFIVLSYHDPTNCPELPINHRKLVKSPWLSISQHKLHKSRPRHNLFIYKRVTELTPSKQLRITFSLCLLSSKYIVAPLLQLIITWL